MNAIGAAQFIFDEKCPGPDMSIASCDTSFLSFI